MDLKQESVDQIEILKKAQKQALEAGRFELVTSISNEIRQVILTIQELKC